MSMKVGQIVREGSAKAALGAIQHSEMPIGRCSRRWNRHMMAPGSSLNASVARAEPLDGYI
jgi:hypothetical protein